MSRGRAAWHQKFKPVAKELRTDRDGTLFASKGELERWKKLELWQLAGEIRNLRRQVRFELRLPDGTPVMVGKKVAIYTADFAYDRFIHAAMSDGVRGCPERWDEVIEDFKGFMSREARFRIAVFEALTGKKVTISK